MSGPGQPAEDARNRTVTCIGLESLSITRCVACSSEPKYTPLDVTEVAEYLRISRSSVYKLIERQQIPAIRIGRLLRVRKKDLDETLHAMGDNR